MGYITLRVDHLGDHRVNHRGTNRICHRGAYTGYSRPAAITKCPRPLTKYEEFTKQFLDVLDSKDLIVSQCFLHQFLHVLKKSEDFVDFFLQNMSSLSDTVARDALKKWASYKPTVGLKIDTDTPIKKWLNAPNILQVIKFKLSHPKMPHYLEFEVLFDRDS